MIAAIRVSRTTKYQCHECMYSDVHLAEQTVEPSRRALPNSLPGKVKEKRRLADTFSSTRANARERRLKRYFLPSFSEIRR